MSGPKNSKSRPCTPLPQNLPISYNAELTSALLAAASSAIKQRVKRMKVNLIFLAGTRWSNQNTKLQKAAFRLWINCSRPKTGGIYRNMANTKKGFKYSLRQLAQKC